MKSFTFQNPTKIIFGEGQIAALDANVPRNARALITCGGGSIKSNGVLAQVQAALGERASFVFEGIEPNPTYETLMQAVALAREKNIDFLLAVGGGSVIDGTKFIAAAMKFDGEPWDILARQAPVRDAVPFGSVLTLPATGSEMNNGSVISYRAKGDKLFFTSDATYPLFSVLDPTTTYSLPPRQIANGVVDAFVHIVEQYLTYPVDAKVQDRFAEGLLITLTEVGPQALAEPHNYSVRANLMWTATLALNGLIGAGVPQDWATHMLGHEITALHGLDHAQTLAIVLPAMLTVRKEQKRGKLLQYAERVWNITEGSEDDRINAAITATRMFFERMTVGTRLRDYQIGGGSIETLIAKLTEHGMTALGEHGDVTPEVSRKVYEVAV
ncbi:iron-containing alcohol dehydrogenase [Paraburkholderia panacisoli]|uniref:Iron-containing alcohol dehydrogenase n=1 Tax=Paraburkholderia panacisoli TaxID=2603818 RepID=A0A5B0G4D5_9BURK|nr:iron-containing alcohol dehydrogenase [Paraburkholderia panacisoli]KAA0998297.1 iron-containing alcohol dehydrogenase [Paraburkholderia panacisoli]